MKVNEIAHYFMALSEEGKGNCNVILRTKDVNDKKDDNIIYSSFELNFDDNKAVIDFDSSEFRYE